MKKISKAKWGSNPNFYSSRDYFRNSLIIKKLRNFVPDGEILDFGCGCGNLTVRLAKFGYKVYAVDSSSASLSVVRKKIKFSPLAKSIKVIDGSYQEIAKLNKKFDAICCGEVLEHIQDDQKVLELFFDSLKPGGKCIITVPARMKYWDASDIWAGHLRRYEKDEILKLFSQAGFKVIGLYCFGPITFLWHKLVFLPILKKGFFHNTGDDNRKKTFKFSLLTSNKMLMSRLLIPLFSYLFYLDIFFITFNLWNYYLLAGHKNFEDKDG